MGSSLSESEFQKNVYTSSTLSLHTEFSYSRASIQSYMILLQNILTGFLLAFSCVLFAICLVVVSHSLSAIIEQNKRDMAILKTVGLTGNGIRRIYLILYGGTILAGLLLGMIPAWLFVKQLARGMVSSTGMRIETKIPIGIIAVFLLFLLVLFSSFLHLRTRKIIKISPIQAIREENTGNKGVKTKLRKSSMAFDLAVRAVLSGKGKYIGICIISILLVVFLSVIGKMGTWLGPNGEGLMDSFSVADHDLGVQPFNKDVPMDEIERIINWYSPVKETYELAMQSVTVNGAEYTANVLNDTEWFHVLSGEVCDGDSVLVTDTVANELGISIGDTVQIAGEGRMESYIVSGIYACANGMGTNIGMSLAGYSKIANITGYIWCIHYILEDGSVRDYAMQYLRENYSGVDVHTNSWSGLDGIVTLMHLLIAVIYLIAAVFILISVFLSASKLLQSETGNMAIYRSIGLSVPGLRVSFALRFLLVVSIGSGLGLILAEAIADPLISLIFRGFGIGTFSSGIGLLGTVLPPVAVITLFSVFAWFSSGKIRR